MPYLKPICQKFASQTLYCRIDDPYLASDSHIQVVNDTTPCVSHAVYIGPERKVRAFYALHAPSPYTTTILTAQTDPPTPDMLNFPTENLIILRTGTMETYAHILSCFHQYHIWRSRLNNAFTYADSRTFLPALSKTTASAVYIYAEANLFLMDYSTVAFHNAYTEQLKTRRLFPEELRPALRGMDQALPQTGVTADGYRYVLHRMTDHSHFSIYLLMIHKLPLSIGIPMNDFLFIVSGQWEKHLNFQEAFYRLTPPTAFDHFLEQLADGQLTDPFLIGEQLESLPFAINPYRGFLYITIPRAENISLYLHSLQIELQDFFPCSNIGFLGDGIVICISSAEKRFSFSSSDENRFSDWLFGKEAFAAVSSLTQYNEKLRTMLLMSRHICSLGCRLHSNSQRRLFTFEKAQTDLVIDLCHDAFIQAYGHDNLTYLTHPSVVLLLQQDLADGTRLLDTLFFYLLSGCSIHATADLTYQHRNTIRNQLKRIQEELKLDLSDSKTRLNLLFSCLILKYDKTTRKQQL